MEEPYRVDEPYQEGPPPAALRDTVQCVWSARARADDDPEAAVLPDGCSDVIWSPGLEPWVAGPDTGPVRESLVTGSLVVGVRFRPGAAPPVLGDDLTALRDARPRLAQLWRSDVVRRLMDQLEGARDVAGAQALLLAAIAAHRSRPPDPVATGSVGRILGAVAAGRRIAHGGDGALGSRQHRRRFRAAVGYGPKTFERIARFQRFRRLARLARAGGGDGGVAALAAACGYADQAHLARECRRLAGRPPSALLGRRAPASEGAGAGSESFKRPAASVPTLAR